MIEHILTVRPPLHFMATFQQYRLKEWQLCERASSHSQLIRLGFGAESVSRIISLLPPSNAPLLTS